jgi:hypothetical protein
MGVVVLELLDLSIWGLSATLVIVVATFCGVFASIIVALTSTTMSSAWEKLDKALSALLFANLSLGLGPS